MDRGVSQPNLVCMCQVLLSSKGWFMVRDDSEMMADRTRFRMKSESLFDFSYRMMIKKD